MSWAFDIIKNISSNSLLCFHENSFCDPAPFLARYENIFPGSFNPVHNAHLMVGYKSLFEISVENFYKGLSDPEDIFHRIIMLSLCRKTVLLTRAMTYTEKEKLFKGVVDKSYTYRIGGDAWNRCIKAPGMFDGVDGYFEVCTYPGEKVDSIPNVRYGVIEINRPDVRASDIRAGKIEDVPLEVQRYIRKNNLYK